MPTVTVGTAGAVVVAAVVVCVVVVSVAVAAVVVVVVVVVMGVVEEVNRDDETDGAEIGPSDTHAVVESINATVRRNPHTRFTHITPTKDSTF